MHHHHADARTRTRSRRLPAVIAASLCVAVGAGAFAQTAAQATKPDGSKPAPQAMAANQQAEAAFKRADTNRDGKLSRTEADHLPAVAARFEQVDTNRDQFISLEEFNRIVAAP